MLEQEIKNFIKNCQNDDFMQELEQQPELYLQLCQAKLLSRLHATSNNIMVTLAYLLFETHHGRRFINNALPYEELSVILAMSDWTSPLYQNNSNSVSASSNYLQPKYQETDPHGLGRYIAFDTPPSPINNNNVSDIKPPPREYGPRGLYKAFAEYADDEQAMQDIIDLANVKNLFSKINLNYRNEGASPYSETIAIKLALHKPGLSLLLDILNQESHWYQSLELNKKVSAGGSLFYYYDLFHILVSWRDELPKNDVLLKLLGKDALRANNFDLNTQIECAYTKISFPSTLQYLASFEQGHKVLLTLMKYRPDKFFSFHAFHPFAISDQLEKKALEMAQTDDGIRTLWCFSKVNPTLFAKIRTKLVFHNDYQTIGPLTENVSLGRLTTRLLNSLRGRNTRDILKNTIYGKQILRQLETNLSNSKEIDDHWQENETHRSPPAHELPFFSQSQGFWHKSSPPSSNINCPLGDSPKSQPGESNPHQIF